MSAETVVTAIFLITAVIAVGVLANAIMPVISTMGGTFSSSANAADEKMRTDFKIVATIKNYTTSDSEYYDYDIFMKNIGSQRISLQEVNQSDVFCGVVDTNIARITYTPNSDPPAGYWTAEIRPANNPNPGFWDPGETLAVYAKPHTQYNIDTSENLNSFQFILPNGVWRSTEFIIT